MLLPDRIRSAPHLQGIRIRMKQNYDVIFSGLIADNASIEQVKTNLSRILKLSDKQLEMLFSSRSVTIKKNVGTLRLRIE